MNRLLTKMWHIHGQEGKDNDTVFEQKFYSHLTRRFLPRFNINNAEIKGKKILEIGSGWGALCIYLGSLGASRVIGIDLDKELVAYSRQKLQCDYPKLSSTVEFFPSELKHLDEYDFDFVFSQCTFEHVADLADLLEQIHKRLKPGGLCCTYFGPLWNSPFGDHRRFHRTLKELTNIDIPQCLLPWSHLVLPESFYLLIINRFNRSGERLDSLYCGINEMSYRSYVDVFNNSKLAVLNLTVNGSGPFRALGLLRKIGVFQELLSVSIAATLSRNPEL